MSAEISGTCLEDDILQQQLKCSQIKDILDCNVCFSVPVTKHIYQCNNGHLLCEDCNKKLTSCPCCRDPLSNVRSLVAEKLLDMIPTRCKFKEYGCNVILPRTDLQTHSKDCQYRTIICPNGDCNQMVCLTQLAEHFKNCHMQISTQVLKPLEESYHSYIRLTIGTQPSSESSLHSCLLFNGVYFFLQAQRIKDSSKDSGYWHVWMYAALTNEECRKFVCDLKISKAGSGEIVSKDGPVVSVDVKRSQVIIIPVSG